MSKKNQTLGEFIIENQTSFKYTSGELSRLINSIRLAAKVVNHEVNKAGLVDIIGAAGETNVQGEEQQKLDVIADNQFIHMFQSGGEVCGIASEENDDFMGEQLIGSSMNGSDYHPMEGGSGGNIIPGDI